MGGRLTIWGVGNIQENNTRQFADKFCSMLSKILLECNYIGRRNWGDPAGQTCDLETYEVKSASGDVIWCTIVEWVNSGTRVENRKGIIATFPTTDKSLGHIVSIMVPYENKNSFNTRAYTDGQKVEIRNYGRVTVGRSGIKRTDFFNYFEREYPQLVFADEEGKKYIKAIEYDEILTHAEFAEQIVNLTILLEEFKKSYRSISQT